jgi:hypothetical protein
MPARVLLAALLPLVTPAYATASPADTNHWHLRGDSATVRNDDGALVVNYAAGRTAESFAQFAGRTPIIWARYNPGEGIGHILVTTSIRRPDAGTEIRIIPFRPSEGTRFAAGGAGKRITYFGGVNPFQQFNGANDEYFRGINFTAFLAAAGLVMRSTSASVAFVYYPALTPAQTVTMSGSAASWSTTGSATFAMQGRWLLGLQGEAGDRRGFVPAYRVLNCDPAIDTRNRCVVKGFASFVPWDFGNLPSTATTLASRSGSDRPELGAMGAAFMGLEGYLRDASLWTDASWSTISGTAAPNGAHALQAAKIGEGDLGRRDRLAEITASGAELGGTITHGMVSPGLPSLWNPSDLATSAFITGALSHAGGGLGVTAAAADWRSSRDTTLVQDLRARRGTQPASRIINETQVAR